MWIPVIHPGGAGSEQLVQVDDWDGLPPVAEGAELWHEEGFVLLFAQQREHVLHQLAQPAVPVERQGGGGGQTGSCGMSVFSFIKVDNKQNLQLLLSFWSCEGRKTCCVLPEVVDLQLRCAPAPPELVAKCCLDDVRF